MKQNARLIHKYLPSLSAIILAVDINGIDVQIIDNSFKKPKVKTTHFSNSDFDNIKYLWHIVN